MLGVGFIVLPGLSLIGLDKDEDVVNTHSQHQEGNDFKDDEGGRHSNKSKCSDTGSH